MKSVFAFAFSLLLTVAASAQNYVYQSGGVTPNHAVRWITNGVVGDGGTAANGFLSSIGVLAQGPAICQQSAALPSPYNQICLGVTSSGGQISFNNVGGATGSLSIAINGTVYPFPGSGAGNVVGPSTSAVGNIATWNSTTGNLLADSGFAIGTSGANVCLLSSNCIWGGVQTFDARVILGTNSPSADFDSALAAGAQTNPLSNGGAHGFRDESTYTPTTSGGYASYDANPVFDGLAISNHLRGFQARPQYSNTGNLSEASGHTMQLTGNSGATISIVSGLHMFPSVLSSGTTVTQEVGIYCDNLTSGVTNFCIYSPYSVPSSHTGPFTFGSQVNLTGSFTFFGSINPTLGWHFSSQSTTMNDASNSTTFTNLYNNVGGGETNTATNSMVYTNLYGWYFKAPTPSTNVTATYTYALGADSINATTLYQGGTAIASTFAPLASPTFTGTVNTAALTIGGQFVTGYGTPTIASGACGTTTNGSIASGGTNQSGQVQIGAASATTCTISFSTTLTAAPLSCTLTPANAAAAAWGTTVARVSSISTTAWVITGSALANANYYYTCI